MYFLWSVLEKLLSQGKNGERFEFGVLIERKRHIKFEEEAKEYKRGRHMYIHTDK